MTDSYDSAEMASDALRGFPPPAYTGVKSFASTEGVHLLATALESAALGSKARFDLEEERDDLLTQVGNLEDRVKGLESDLKDASEKIKEALECLR